MPTHPPIDPEIAAALAADPGPASIRPEDIAAQRDRTAATAPTREELECGGAVTVTDLTIPGPPDNPALEALVLRSDSGPPAEPQPGIAYIHGGGMVMGSRFKIEATMLAAARRGITVISIEYRLAPEHPFPAALDDCYAAWTWIAGHAAEVGIDPARLALAGSSAGGGLAAGTVLRVRDAGGVLPCHQILFWPMLDDRQVTPSSQELDGEGRWDRTANRTGWSAYLAGRAGNDDVPAYAAPARETVLTGLPPTFIDVGAVDTFRDEDIDYAARLNRAGVATELHVWPGGVHGFLNSAPDAAVSRAALAARVGYLERHLLRVGDIPR